MPQEYFEVVAHHLPPEEPVRPCGGRPLGKNETAPFCLLVRALEASGL